MNKEIPFWPLFTMVLKVVKNCSTEKQLLDQYFQNKCESFYMALNDKNPPDDIPSWLKFPINGSCSITRTPINALPGSIPIYLDNREISIWKINIFVPPQTNEERKAACQQ